MCAITAPAVAPGLTLTGTHGQAQLAPRWPGSFPRLQIVSPVTLEAASGSFKTSLTARKSRCSNIIHMPVYSFLTLQASYILSSLEEVTSILNTNNTS